MSEKLLQTGKLLFEIRCAENNASVGVVHNFKAIASRHVNGTM